MSEMEFRHYLKNGDDTSPEAREALEWATETQAAMVDLKFCDLLGTWQHMTLPLRAFDESSFDEGLGFDGSSIRGWQGISESDMLLMPQADTAILDPATAAPTLSLICEIVDPVTREPYSRDPRQVARRAEEHLQLDRHRRHRLLRPRVRVLRLRRGALRAGPTTARTTASTRRRGTGTRASPGLGYTVRPKEGYFPPAPHDTLHDLRTEMVLTLERIGIPCEFHHHEVASGGQCEIDLRFQTLTRMADQVMTYKYVVKNVARRHGKTATFMPKPIFGDNGSGMHTHQSLWMEGTPLMADKSGYAGLSQLGRAYVAGLLAHAPALLALLRADDELVPPARPGLRGAGQPRLLAAQPLGVHPHPDVLRRRRRRSAIEFRCPDAAANPYLAFSAMLMAGLDGIERGLDPGDPADYDLFEESTRRHPAGARLARGRARRARGRPRVPARGRRLHEDLIDTWIDYKRENGGRHRRGCARTRPSSPSTSTPSRCRRSSRRPCTSRRLRDDDWHAVRAIYEEGIATGNATFETEAPSWEDWDAVASPGAPRWSRELDGKVVGWAALSATSRRRCYRGRGRGRASTSQGPRAGRGSGGPCSPSS